MNIVYTKREPKKRWYPTVNPLKSKVPKECSNQFKPKDLFFLVEQMNKHDVIMKTIHVNMEDHIPVKGGEYDGPESICKGVTKENVALQSASTLHKIHQLEESTRDGCLLCTDVPTSHRKVLLF